MSGYRLSVDRNPKGPGVLAIITRGGHPQVPNSGTCEVCDVKIMPNRKAAKRWFERQIIAKPWDVANDQVPA